MMKKISLKKMAVAFCFMLSANLLLAQTQNPLWNLQPNYSTITTSTFFPPAPLPTATTSTYGFGTGNSPYGTVWGYSSGSGTLGPNNMYKDANNNPLLFINGSTVYNRNGYLIDELYLAPTVTYTNGSTGDYYEATGYSEVCVVPKPGSCTQYYVFTSGFNDTSNNVTHISYAIPGYRAYYALIDVAANGGTYMPGTEYGKNITPGLSGGSTVLDLLNSTNTPTLASTDIQRPIYVGDVFYAATKPRSDGSRLLFMYNNSSIFIYQITSSGVSYLTSYSTSTLTQSGGTGIGFGANMRANVTEMELYTDETNGIYKLAVGGSTNAASNIANGILFANFSISTGSFVANSAQQLSLKSSSSIPYNAAGIEFSPDGNWVYFTNQSGGNYSGSIIAVSYTNPATSYTRAISTDYGFKDSQIELGTDGNMYVLKYGSSSSSTLYKISGVNTPSTATTSSVTTLSNYAFNNYILTNNGSGLYPVFNSLPDQIDGEVYGSQFDIGHASQCCLIYEPYDKVSYSAGTTVAPTWTTTATTQTWSPNTATVTNNPLAISGNTTATVTIGEELRIPAGYTVTINNMTIQFSPQARLIIENGTSSKNGGKLVLNGCTLTVDNRCGYNDMWPGVQVWGTPSNGTHNYPYHGSLFLNSSTVIENAYAGVTLGYGNMWASSTTPDPGAPYVNPANYSMGTFFGGGGGIFQSQSSTFLNNEEDLVVFPYTVSANTVPNQATTTTFTCNATLLNSSVSPDRHINIISNNLNTYFSGVQIGNSAYTHTEYGLYSSNSSFTMDNATSGCAISNQMYGIYALNSGGNSNTFKCNGSTFTSNFYGVYAGFVNNIIVETNTITVYYSSLSADPSYSYGIYIDNGTGYAIKDNLITNAARNKVATYGIIANNTVAADVIFRNTLNRLTVGSQAQYQNYIYSAPPSYAPNDPGLQYICNTFTNNISKDIYVPSNSSADNVIESGTSYTTYPAGIAYQQGATSSTLTPVSGNTFSHISSGHDFLIDPASYSSNLVYYCASGTCTTSTTYPQNSIAPSSTLAVTPWNVNTSCSTINTYTCSGCRTVEGSDPMLPLLSDADAYKAVFDSITNVIDGGNAPTTNSDAYRQLMNKRNAAFSNRHLLLDEVIRTYLGDTSYTNVRKAYTLMKVKALEMPARTQVETGLNLHDTIMVTNALAQVTAQEGQSNYVKLSTLLASNMGKSTLQLMSDNSVVNQLRDIASDSSDRNAYTRAKLLLASAGKAKFVPYIIPDSNNTQADDAARHAVQNDEIANTISESTLFNQPNPFTESTVIQANVVEKTQNAYVVVTDMIGAEIARYPVQQGANSITINAGNLNQSVMFCTLVVDGAKVATNKMVMMK